MATVHDTAARTWVRCPRPSPSPSPSRWLSAGPPTEPPTRPPAPHRLPRRRRANFAACHPADRLLAEMMLKPFLQAQITAGVSASDWPPRPHGSRRADDRRPVRRPVRHRRPPTACRRSRCPPRGLYAARPQRRPRPRVPGAVHPAARARSARPPGPARPAGSGARRVVLRPQLAARAARQALAARMAATSWH
jgi:hypothetical protein